MKNTLCSLCSLVTLGLLSSTASMFGTITIFDGLDQKPDVYWQNYGNWGGVHDTRSGSKEGRDNTQTFVITEDMFVDQFVISVNDAMADISVTFRVFEITSTPLASTLTLGNELASELYTFTLSDQTLTAGNETDNILIWDVSDFILPVGNYALQIDGPEAGPASGLHIAWRGVGDPNTYSAGSQYRNFTPGGSLDIRDADTALGIVGGPAAMIPEPSTILFLLVGASALAIVSADRRRRS